MSRLFKLRFSIPRFSIPGLSLSSHLSGALLAIGLIGVGVGHAAHAAEKIPSFTLPAHADQAQRSLALEAGKSLTYQIISPKGWTPATSSPVLLLLPPGGQNAAMVSAALSFVAPAATRRGWVIICPQAPEGESFNGAGGKYLLPLLASLRANLNIEGNRLHLAGISNGGRSALALAVAAPAELASVYVFPGAFGNPLPDHAELKKLQALPVRMFVGERDDISWHKAGEASVVALKNAGVDARLEVRKGEGHILDIGDEVIVNTLEGFRPVAAAK
jgi:predicted peptidase